MKRLVIAIDCDDVLVPCTEYLVHEYNRLFGTQISLGAAHVFTVDTWGAEREEVHRRLDAIQLSDEYAQIIPHAKAIGSVERLASSHELHMVTARPEVIMGVTQRMIDRYFPNCFTSVHHVGPTGNKGDECVALRADVLIDDSLKHLLGAQTAGIANLLWFGHYPWQDRSVVPGGISVVSGWTHVAERITRLSHG